MAGRRLANEFRDIPDVSSVELVTGKDIKNVYTIFYAQHKNFFRNNPRGFGLWLWKPFIVLQKLLDLPKNDLLLYLDAGCQTNFQNRASIERWYDYLDITRKEDSLFMKLRHGQFGIEDLSEFAWSKAKLIKKFNLDYENLESPQVQAGILFLKNTDSIRDLISEWLELCIENNYSLLDSTTEKEHERFIAHRFDQSIFSLLVKQQHRFTIPDETSFDNLLNIPNYPILALRNRTGANILRNNYIDRLIVRLSEAEQTYTNSKSLRF